MTRISYVMTARQKEQVWLSLQKYGWTYQVITNKDGGFGDGGQELKSAGKDALSLGGREGRLILS